MSNYLAIAAVTATLRNLLMNVDMGIPADPALADTQITTRPLDRARTADDNNQINLFLYHTAPNAALRNMDMVERMRPRENGQLPLALNLYYLMTAYGRGNDDLMTHRLLGRGMSIMHDYPILSPTEIRDALAGNDLYRQIEHVRINPQNLSVDEMFRLWATFQTAYRISVVYEVAVVLIESTRPISAFPPVIGIGSATVPAVAPLFPTLDAIEPPMGRSSARLGDVLSLRGVNLDGDSVAVRFNNRSLAQPIILEPLAGRTASELSVHLPGGSTAQRAWRAGPYTVSVDVSKGGEIHSSNELPLAVAPSVVEILPSERYEDGTVALTVICSPAVYPEQRVALLLGDREIVAEPPVERSTVTLDFIAAGIPPGEYYIRLRVDGVDSILVDLSGPSPIYDPQMRATIA